MSTPSPDRLVANARVGPDDSPHEAAAHVWAQVVTAHDVAPNGPLAQLGVFDRVVLVLRDVIGLSDATVAHVLNTSEDTARRAHGHARSRVGLPPPGGDECPGWADVRADTLPGDPVVLERLLAHTAGCAHCSQAVREDQRLLHPWWARRTVAAAAHRTAPASVPAVVSTLGAVAAVVTSAVVLGAAIAPLPDPPLPQPVVVDDDPGLPSDEEPPEGWPPPATLLDGGPVDDASSSGTTSEQPTELIDDLVDDVTGTIGDTTEPLTDPLQDAVDGVTDTVEETVDEITDTVEETVDEATDAVDELVDDAAGTTGDAADTATDPLDDLP